MLFGMSSWVRILTTPGAASRARVDGDDARVVPLRAVHLEVEEVGELEVLEELRASGDVAARVDALDDGTDRLELARAFGVLVGEVARVDLRRGVGHRAACACSRSSVRWRRGICGGPRRPRSHR
jgi:hypothetical protein